MFPYTNIIIQLNKCHIYDFIDYYEKFNSQLIQIQVRKRSFTSEKKLHMQNMSVENEYQSLFLKRRHKLYKGITQKVAHPNVDDQSSKTQIVNLYEFLIKKEHKIHQINYYLKHQFKCCLEKYANMLIWLIWKLRRYRQNHIVSFVYYRLSRKYPVLYWITNQLIQQKIMIKQPQNQQQASVLTDLFLYGYPISQQNFISKILPSFQQFIVIMIPKYLGVLINNQVLSLKSQKIVKSKFEQWIGLQKDQINTRYDKLKEKGRNLQNRIVKQTNTELQETSYQNSLQEFQALLYKFQLASHLLNIHFQIQAYLLKSIFKLKNQCQYFRDDFKPSQFERSLYFSRDPQLKSIESIKKSDINKLQFNQAYINRVKQCCSTAQSIKLSGYFIQQLNIEHNRQQFIEMIIDDCNHFNNLSYIVKILSQINQIQPQIKQYCQLKGRKICSQNKMNQKYQKLLCQMCRFNIMDQGILLDYCQKILKYENSAAIKQIQSILESLGSIIYYRSLQSHIRINCLFDRMQATIKNKMNQFNIDNLLHIKSILNHLKNPLNNRDQNISITRLEIRINFKFIQKKLQKLLKNSQFEAIVELLTQGINQQQFLNVYYYSSLIKELNSKVINDVIYARAKEEIFRNLQAGNLQNGVKWGRFLGQLYSYSIINRKKLIQAFQQILNKQTQDSVLDNKIKIICAALDIAKQYVLSSEQNNENKLAISFLFQLKVNMIHTQKILFKSQIGDMIGKCQIDDIMDYFHPYLSKIKSIEEIELIESVQANENQANNFHNNLYYYLDLLNSGFDLRDLLKKQASSIKYIQKPRVKYREKDLNSKESDNRQDIQKISQQSHKTSQTNHQSLKKSMKIIGRDKNTKVIKKIMCSYVQQQI